MDSTFNKVKESLAKFDLKAYEAMTAAKEILTDNLALIIMQNLIYFLPKYYDRKHLVNVSVEDIVEITQHIIRVEVLLNGECYRELTIPIELVTDEAKLKVVVAAKKQEMEQERRKAKKKQKADKEERDYALYLELKRKYEPEPKSIGGQDDRI